MESIVYNCDCFQEEWKAVVFNNNYEVSNFGNVRRKGYYRDASNGNKAYVKPIDCNIKIYNGKSCVSICKKLFGVATLVAQHFITDGVRPNKVIHIDGNIQNNRIDNILVGGVQTIKMNEFTNLNEVEYLKLYYDVSTNGVVSRKKDGHIYHCFLNHKGYKCVRLKSPAFSKNKDRRKNYRVHRLVAMYYLQDYSDKLQVNHKNGIKTDNRVENLEMVTNQENVLHAWRVLDSAERRKKIGEITKKWRKEYKNGI